MRLYLTMPKPGETIREGSIVRWLKKPGDPVREKVPLVELETEKAVFTYESPFCGVLQEILVNEGESIPVGGKIALVEVSQKEGENYLALGVGIPADEGRSTPSPPTSHLSPLLRNLAKEHHLLLEELGQIPKKDPAGRLTKEDVLEYVKNKSPAAPLEKGERGGFKREGEEKRTDEMEFEIIPLSPIRARIAQNMKKSNDTIPQAASSVDVDMTQILDFVYSHREEFFQKYAFTLSSFLFFLYSVRETLKRFPLFNSSLMEEDGKPFIHHYKKMNFGIAVATPKGLFNPVLKEVEDLSFQSMGQKIFNLEKKAREGSLSVDEITGATFAVNNPGALGGSRCYQIIPHPLAAIVGLNRIQKRPWVHEDQIVIRKIVTVDLSFDHRILDGADAIQFVEELKRELENFEFKRIRA